MPRTLLLAVALALCAGALTAGEPARPNILIIMADDLADWHLGCYGNKEIKTPHIDKFAADGTRMANSFCATPICSPSRATFFTGRLPRQHGIYDFLGKPIPEPPQAQAAPPPSFKNEPMISDVFAAAGYTCGYIGKWHMGDDRVPQHNYSFWYSLAAGGSAPYRDPSISLNGKHVEETGYVPEIFTARALEYIREKREKPWLLVVSYTNPHTPYEGHPQKYYDMYFGCRFETFGIEPPAPNLLREGSMMKEPLLNLRKAAAATTALDDQIPPLLKALDDSGQRRNTLVMFTADNGYLYGRHGAWSKGHATNPINMYEEVIRVPMIYQYPEKLQPGRVIEQFVSFYDVLPTLCDAAGIQPPQDRRLVGRSYWPVLLGEHVQWDNSVYCTFRNTECLRDERYKIVLRNSAAGPNELFDLKEDPREKKNIFGLNESAPIRERMIRKLSAWMEKNTPGN
ncbi:MAG TPA: sulfatase-like hydrolase/transferase [Planctomycetota bacterium]|nr:sulfatase-like hydrolase/transferase [Planctomycetota bacterium]